MERTSEQVLRREIEKLCDENERLKKLTSTLVERNGWYRQFFEACPVGIMVTKSDFSFIDANEAFLELVGYRIDEIIAEGPDVLLRRQWFDIGQEIINSLTTKGETTFTRSFTKKDGSELNLRLTARLTNNSEGLAAWIIVFIENLHEQTLLGEAQQKTGPSNEERLQDLEKQNGELSLLLRQAQKEAKGLEDRIVHNMKKIVDPQIRKLMKSKINKRQTGYLNQIQANLENIISPFYSRLTSRFSDLTPAEIRIAGLIKDGYSSREISRMLGLKTGTVEFHRNNLRKKLGIRNTGISLKIKLQDID